MGDAADMALEQALEHEADIDDFRSGRMDVHKAYDLGIVDHLGYDLKSQMVAGDDGSPSRQPLTVHEAMLWLDGVEVGAACTARVRYRPPRMRSIVREPRAVLDRPATERGFGRVPRAVEVVLSKCRHCAAGPFVWVERQGQWRLADPSTGEVHTCYSQHETDEVWDE